MYRLYTIIMNSPSLVEQFLVLSRWTMTALIQFESLVDSIATEFFKQLSKRYADCDGESVISNFGTWLQFYAPDVIEELTCLRQLGFLSSRVDIGGIIRNLEKLLDHFVTVRASNSEPHNNTDWCVTFQEEQMPMPHHSLLRNPIWV